MTFKALKLLTETKSLPSDGKTVSWIVSSSNVACAYANKRSTADLYDPLPLADYVVIGSSS